MKKIISTLLTLMILLPVFAQDRITVKGTILDETGTPLIGAGVSEKGTSNGVSVDSDGRYRLSVPGNAVLVASYLGYLSEEKPVGGEHTINCTSCKH